MKQDLVLSIITVCYNSDKTISRCLESVKSQNKSFVEHIIIDGGSTDNTIEIVHSIDVSDIIISEPDQGIYDAMNKGINAASGKYILFLNSDDHFSSNTVLSQIVDELVFKPETPILFCDVNIFNENDKLVRTYHASRWFKSWMIYLGVTPAHPGAIIAKDLIQKNNNFDKSFKIAGDFDLIAKVILQKNKYRMMDTVLTNMLAGGVSSSGVKSYIQTTKEISVSLKRLGCPVPWLNILRLPFKYFVGKIGRQDLL